MKRILALLALLPALALGQVSDFNGPSVATNIVPVALCRATTTQTATNVAIEQVVWSCPIPAGRMGPNGILRLSFTARSTGAGNKTIITRIGGLGGTAYTGDTIVAQQKNYNVVIANANSASSQISGMGDTSCLSYGCGGAGTIVTSAVNTGNATTLDVTCTKATAGDLCTVTYALVELILGP